MERLIVLDGNSLINRAYYALPLLKNSKGVYTNAVVGFFTMLFKMKEQFDPEYITVTFDLPKKTFRHEKYEDYKAGRKSMPDELREQFPLIKDILRLMDINIYEIEGYEADDVIGTISRVCDENNIECFVITGDKDALQLASDNTKVIITKKGISETEIYDRNRMTEEFKVTPSEFIDVKGLMGDTSDNIPGVPGIGEKTAFKLIEEYKSIEAVLENIDNIKGKKLVENLKEYSEQALFSKFLATIIRDVPIEIDFEDIRSKEKYEIEELREYFLKLELKVLLGKLPKSEKAKEEVVFTKINTTDEFLKYIKKVSGEIFLDYTLDFQNILNIKATNFTIKFNGEITSIDMENIEMNEDVIKELKVLFESKCNKIICSNMKEIEEYLKVNFDISFENAHFDIALASYLVESSRKENDIISLIEGYLHVQIEDKPHEKVFYYEELYKKLLVKIEEYNMQDLLFEIEMPLTRAISIMEINGFKVNEEEIIRLGIEFSREIEITTKEIYEISGEEFNINSPKQLGVILFEKLGLPVIKKTKTGYSTNAEVLEALRGENDIIEKIFYFRQLSKLYSTYIEGIKPLILDDGKIHSKFNQLVTTTGRLSSTEPNLQNIPIKYEMGREIRKAFIPREGNLLLSADYSQIELRVMAHLSSEENLINAFKEDVDIHTKTASEVFGVSLDKVTSVQRGRAKAVNFGIIYGIGDFSLAKDLKIFRNEAKKYIDTYFARYPKVKDYLDSVIEICEKDGFVSTITNRRRYIPEINSSNKMTKNLGIRLAMNAPVQGTAADIIKIAMVKIQRELSKRNLKSTLILQVHDELILDVFEEEMMEVKELVRFNMENAVSLSVPLKVDINVGKSWYEAK